MSPSTWSEIFVWSSIESRPFFASEVWWAKYCVSDTTREQLLYAGVVTLNSHSLAQIEIIVMLKYVKLCKTRRFLWKLNLACCMQSCPLYTSGAISMRGEKWSRYWMNRLGLARLQRLLLALIHDLYAQLLFRQNNGHLIKLRNLILIPYLVRQKWTRFGWVYVTVDTWAQKQRLNLKSLSLSKCVVITTEKLFNEVSILDYRCFTK